MQDSQEQLIFELSKKYVFETFDFRNRSPEELIKYYQEVSEKITKVIEEQNAEIIKQNTELLSKFNF